MFHITNFLIDVKDLVIGICRDFKKSFICNLNTFLYFFKKKKNKIKLI